MAYSDFTLQAVEAAFGVIQRPILMFPESKPVGVPTWLRESLDRGMELPLASEKARGELIVMPVLLTCRELSGRSIAIYSGSRLDVDASRGLVGECDFLLARSPSVPEIRAPLVAIVEAKKNDIDAGLGQCVAQMIGARLFNERAGHPDLVIHGCVTTGEIWQFLRLDGTSALIDTRRYFLIEVPEILGIFQGLFPAIRAE